MVVCGREGQTNVEMLTRKIRKLNCISRTMCLYTHNKSPGDNSIVMGRLMKSQILCCYCFFFYRNPLSPTQLYTYLFVSTLLVASAALSGLCHSSWQEQTGMVGLVQPSHSISALNETSVLGSAQV